MVAPMHTGEVLRDKLTRAFAPLELDITDDSEKHRGHKGAGGGGHFSVRIVSSAFEGKSLVARHRLVYAELAEEMRGAVHALALDTLTPAEAEAAAAAAADEAEARILTNA
jgi:stress-induced morphogen